MVVTLLDRLLDERRCDRCGCRIAHDRPLDVTLCTPCTPLYQPCRVCNGRGKTGRKGNTGATDPCYRCGGTGWRPPNQLEALTRKALHVAEAA